MNQTRIKNKQLNYIEREDDLPKVQSLPLVAKIEVTNKCNLYCKMCRNKEDKREIIDLDFKVFRKLEPLFPSLLSAYLYGIGEVLTYPNLTSLINLLLKYNVNVGLITNGLLINEMFAIDWVQKGLYKLSISIDGAKKETYESIRRGADFDRLISNVKLINKFKKKYNKTRPKLTFNFVAMRSNIEELPTLIELAASLGVAEVIVNDLIVFFDNMQEEALQYTDPLCYENFKKAELIAREKQVDLFLPTAFCFQHDNALSSDDANAKDKNIINRCSEPWSGFWLTSDGKVTPCCYWMKEMGDINKDSFQTIWNNDNYQALRKIVNTDRRSKHCRECAIAGMERRK